MTTLVVTDLDGTVWDRSLHAHPRTREAIAEVQARDDIQLLVATGRRRNSARRDFKANGFIAPAVLLNGAVGFDFEADDLFHQVSFGTEALERTLQGLQSFDLAPVAYLSDTRALVVEGVTTSVAHLDSLGTDLHWATFEDVAPRTDVLGMSMLGVDENVLAPAFEALRDVPGIEAAAYADHLYPPFSMMLAPENVTKAVGVRAYCDHTGLAPDRIIALGDGGNDLEMLAMADLALAVEGADERAIALADQIIERPEHGGWATVLDYL